MSRPFESWPGCFVPKILAKTNRQKEILLKSIESCIKRRMEFRKECTIPCSKVIKGKDVHDELMGILQILRAVLIVDVDRTWENWILRICTTHPCPWNPKRCFPSPNLLRPLPLLRRRQTSLSWCLHLCRVYQRRALIYTISLIIVIWDSKRGTVCILKVLGITAP